MIKVKNDLTDRKFGRLTVITQTEDKIDKNGRKRARWLCECDCGNPEFVTVIGEHLISGHTKSCGCLQKEARIQNGKNPNSHKREKLCNQYDILGEFGIGWTSNTNKKFYFDIEDYNKIKTYTWEEDSNGYIVDANNKVFMHRIVMNCPNNLTVDHIYHNKNDNRKCKLRICTQSNNNMNRSKQSNNTSGHIGVYFHKPSNSWCAYIKINNKQYRKYFQDKESAILCRKNMEEKYFNEYAYKGDEICLNEQIG